MNLKINDLLNYSSRLYDDQGYNLENKDLHKELQDFLKDRFRYYLKAVSYTHLRAHET